MGLTGFGTLPRGDGGFGGGNGVCEPAEEKHTNTHSQDSEEWDTDSRSGPHRGQSKRWTNMDREQRECFYIRDSVQMKADVVLQF